jgi:hypothetical protein
MRSPTLHARTVVVALAVLAMAGCADKRHARVGDHCGDDSDCVDGLCYANTCLDPDGDDDGDGLKNGVEVNVCFTDPTRDDTDGDGAPDGVEVGPDPQNPIDTDGDGKIDAVESSKEDADKDCIWDQWDAHDDVYDTNVGALMVTLRCSGHGVCGVAPEGVIKATCDAQGAVTCDYAAVAGFEAAEATCDGSDNDCDGQTDEDVTVPADVKCSTDGVCGEVAVAVVPACAGGKWTCDYTKVPGYREAEDLCDADDNDCNGQTDETWPDLGKDCEAGKGECVAQGKWVCTADATGAECDAEPGTPSEEVCDGLDNNCDGQTDEGGICQKTARILGQVYDPTMRPGLPSVAVGLHPGADCAAEALDKTETDADGGFTLHVAPGDWCLSFALAGYLPVVTQVMVVTDKEDYPLDVALTPSGTTLPPFLTACGRVTATAPVAGAPVTAVSVSLLDAATGAVLGGATTDEAGHWCVSGVATGDGATWTLASFVVAAVRDGYFLAKTEPLPFVAGVLPIVDLAIAPKPTNVTTCLADDFESAGTTGSLWTADQEVGGVGWHLVGNGVHLNGAIGSCVSAPAMNEDCAPNLEDPADTCALCPAGTPDARPGCIPQVGALPNAWSGKTAWHFGNLELNSFLTWEASCSDLNGGTGQPVAGSLTSPWIEATKAVTLELRFASAWEVESFAPAQADQLLVEVQTGAMVELQKWATVDEIKDAEAVKGKPSQPCSSGGLDAAPAWKSYSYDLTAYVGDQVRVRFRFDSTDGSFNGFRGWLVDSVEVVGAGCPQ